MAQAVWLWRDAGTGAGTSTTQRTNLSTRHAEEIWTIGAAALGLEEGHLHARHCGLELRSVRHGCIQSTLRFLQGLQTSPKFSMTMRTAARAHVEILVLGAGWTFTFLLPLLEKESVRYAATSTTGRDDTIPFRFDSDSDNIEPFKTLPTATTVLITFPLTGHGQATKLVDLYTRSRSSVVTEGAGPPPDVPFFIQFGATSIFTDP